MVDHLERIVNIAGEDVPAIGTDYDGAISPPPDLPTILELPRWPGMLRRGLVGRAHPEDPGGNFLRTVQRLRGRRQSAERSQQHENRGQYPW
ncbi:MAG: membrane dipeptidase [Sandaracinaceae bacterium]|nr:membrane dipeptidase [Sandaracinaceae bacterium]